MRIIVSIGFAAYPLEPTNANDLLERADAAMYYTKQTGRNGVSYADPSGTLTHLAIAPV